MNATTRQHEHLPDCELYATRSGRAFRWRWKAISPDGATLRESEKSFPLYYECVEDARSNGLHPAVCCP